MDNSFSKRSIFKPDLGAIDNFREGKGYSRVRQGEIQELHFSYGIEKIQTFRDCQIAGSGI